MPMQHLLQPLLLLVGPAFLGCLVAAETAAEEEGRALRGARAEEQCRTAEQESECYKSVMWARQHGIAMYPEWYPGLNEDSSFEEFQYLLFKGGHGPKLTGERRFQGCGPPCSTTTTGTATSTSTTVGRMLTTGAPPAAGSAWGWRPTAELVGGEENWCMVQAPPEDFTLRSCGVNAAGDKTSKLQIKVLSYNLFWWNLFKQRGGGGAGQLIAMNNNGPEPFDFMGFQECEDVAMVMQRAGLSADFAHLQGAHALGLAYRHAAWELLATETHNVAEDNAIEWYGIRSAQWARFRHRSSGNTAFFANHHGPLPLNSGGRCGLTATAFNLLRLIATLADPADLLVLVGDFNADIHSESVRQLSARMHRVFDGTAFGGIDHVFSNCGGTSVKRTGDLGSGGSDHNAIEVVLEV